MKKHYSLLTIAALAALTGCNSSPEKTPFEKAIYKPSQTYEVSDYQLDLKVVAPTGAPAVGLYGFADKWNDLFFTSSNPATGVIPMFQSQEYDVIVAPTDSGLNQILNLGANYKIAATITFGNFYIVSTGTDTDNTLNDGDKVVIFQENGIPGKTFRYLYGDLNLTTISVAGAADTKLIMQNNGVYDGVTYDYVLTAEPIMSSINKTAFIDIQKAFEEKSGGKLMTQASVFLKKDLKGEKADKFLYALKGSIEAGLDNPDLFQTAIASVGSAEAQQSAFGVPGAMAKKVGLNNGFNLGFKFAYEIKEDIKEFVNLISPDVNI